MPRETLCAIEYDIEAADARQAKIEDDNVGSKRTIHRDAQLSITGLADYMDFSVTGEHGVKSDACKEVILNEEDADLLHIPIHLIT